MPTADGKQSLKLRAYQYIKDKILTCAFAPGELVNEQKLCEEIGISRTPVRDALSRLEQEGLITILPKKGTIVTDINILDISRIFEVRLIIEPYALLHYGAEIPAEQLRTISLSLEDIDRSRGDPRFYYDSDDAFHAMVVDAMPNRYLRSAYAGIRDSNMRLRVLCGRSGMSSRIEETFAEHRAILTACMNADWDAAANAMSHHLEMSRQDTLQNLMRQAGAGAPDGEPQHLSPLW